MTFKELQDLLSLKLVAGEKGLSNEVKGCYVCDLLSWVLGKANSGDILVTVMGNANAVAIVSMIDLCGIILTENAPLDDDAKNKADTFGIPVLSTKLNNYEFAIAFSKAFKD